MSLLTGQAEAALTRLYQMADRTTDNFTLERIDRALDEIVRLNSSEPPAYQVRSAMANALKVLADRRALVPPANGEVEPGGADPDQPVVDLRLWLGGTRRLSDHQRRLLTLLSDGYDANAIAALSEIPVRHARERISRARRAARAAHQLDMFAA